MLFAQCSAAYPSHSPSKMMDVMVSSRRKKVSSLVMLVVS